MAYSGSLKVKKKAELQEIASALKITYEENDTRPQLETLIRDEIKANAAHQSDPKFSGLWHSIENQEGSATTAQTPGRSVRRKSVGASSAPNSGAANGSPIKDAANMALAVIDKNQGKVVRYLNDGWATSQKYGQQASEVTKHSVARVQYNLSSSWTINLVALLLELLFVVASIVPYTRKYKLGPFKWFTYQWTPEYPWTLTVPDVLVLGNANFGRSLAGWAVVTVLVPLIIAQLIVFPAPPARGRSSQRPHPPSPVSFAISRFAIAFYLGRLGLQGYASKWNWDIVSRFSEVQLVAAGTALAFALYETTVKH